MRKRPVMLSVLIVLGAVVLWLAWPARLDESAEQQARTTYAQWRSVAQTDPVNLSSEIAASEARFADLKPSAAARVTWAGQEGVKTPISLVYLHGFSASSMEIDPVVGRVADALGANVFYPRLAGHGRSGDALGSARFETWRAEAEEAIGLASELGERVIVIATSNGAALAHIVTQTTQAHAPVAGMILVSPNFAVNNPLAGILTLPKARVWAPWIFGPERSFEPRSPLHETYWTTRYGSKVVVEVVKTTKQSQAAPRSAVVPTLIMGSQHDKIVRADVAMKIGKDIGAQWIEVPLEGTVDPDAHVVLGDVLSPSNTEWAVSKLIAFIRQQINA